MLRARKERAPSRANRRRPSGRPGSLSQPSGSIGSRGKCLGGLGRGLMEWKVWPAACLNRNHHADPLKRASRGGRPRAGCRAWARSVLVVASDQVLRPQKEVVSRGNRLSLKALGNLEQ